MIIDLLSAIIIGVSSVLQVSFYLTIKKKGLMAVHILLITVLVFGFTMLDGLSERIAFALFSTLLMCLLCHLSYNEDAYCKAYNALSQGTVSIASNYLAISIAAGQPLFRLMIVFSVNFLWCLAMFQLRHRVFTVMPLPTGLYKKPLRMYIVFYLLLLTCSLGTDSFFQTELMPSQSFSVMIVVASTMTIMVVLNMFVYTKKGFYRQQQIQTIEAKNILMKQYVDDYVNYSGRIRIIQHDHQHLLIALTRLLQLGDTKRALDLLAMMTARNYSNSAHVFCDNNLINAILMDASQRCSNLGVSFQGVARLPDPVTVEDVDLAALLMNIINNAIECCEGMESRENASIDFCVYTAGGCLAVKCKNTVIEPPEINGGRIVTTKEPDGKPHGVGLESIAHIADKYEGCMNLSADDQFFNIEVVIQNGLSEV